MNVVVYQSSDIPEEAYTIVSAIIKNTFLEREQQGIHFACRSFGPDDIKAYYRNGGGGKKIPLCCI